MHAKQKGVVGVWSVATYLVKKNYPVFIELSDLSKTDIIVQTENKSIKLQVKAITSREGKAELKGSKSGPNYHFDYKKSDVDIFAVYVLDTGDIAFVPNDFLEKRKVFTLRVFPSKNKQTKHTHPIEQYKDFTRVLRDYTRNVQNGR